MTDKASSSADAPLLITEETLRSLPRDASRGLFLAFCETGNRPFAIRCMNLLSLMDSDGRAFDADVCRAYLSAFREPDDLAVFFRKAKLEWDAANLAFEKTVQSLQKPHSMLHGDRRPQPMELGGSFVRSLLSGQRSTAELLLGLDFASLKAKGNLKKHAPSFSVPVAASSGQLLTHAAELSPLEAALLSDDAEMAFSLASRPELERTVKNILSLPRYELQRQYSAGSDFTLDLFSPDLWIAVPKGASALLRERAPSDIHPQILQAALSSSSESFDQALAALGPEAALSRAFVDSGSGSKPFLRGMLRKLTEASPRIGEARVLSSVRTLLALPSFQEALLAKPKSSQESGNLASDLLPLYFSESRDIRSSISESAGFEPLRALAESLKGVSSHTARSVILRAVSGASGAGDMAALRSFLSGLDFSSIAYRESQTAQTGMAAIVTAASPAALREILAWATETAGSSTLYSALIQEGWILENINLKKKGDALAAAIGDGDPLKAEALLEAFPHLDKSRAKETLKYLQGRDRAALAKSTSAFERLLMGKALEAAAPAASPKRASRGL